VDVGGLTMSGVSRNRGGFVKCVVIQKRLGIPGIDYRTYYFSLTCSSPPRASIIPAFIILLKQLRARIY
jgi:hypothetical protein